MRTLQVDMSAMRGLRYALKHQTMDCVVGGFTHTKDGLAVSSLLLGLFESNYENARIMIAHPTWAELDDILVKGEPAQ